MNKTIIAILLATAVTNAQAETPMEFCTAMSEAAEAIMRTRQAGAPMRKAMEITEQKGASEELIALTKVVVAAAYKHPKYTTTKAKEEAITEFGSEFMVDCLSQAPE